MALKRTFDDIEKILCGFAPAEPSSQADARIRQAARSVPVGRWHRAAVLAAGLAGAVCLGIFLYTRTSTPDSPPPQKPFASVKDITTELAFSVIKQFRGELEEIDEMREMIPSERKAARRRISEKLDACLRRLAQIENRLRLKPGSSHHNVVTRKEVNV